MIFRNLVRVSGHIIIMKYTLNTFVNFFKGLTAILVLVVALSCATEDDTPNFTDASNLRLKSLTSYTSVNPDQKFTYFFQYDANNRLVHIQSNSLGSTLDFIYDSDGRLIQVGDYEYYYNSDGNIYKIKNDNLLVASGKYDSTMVNYSNGYISSFVESFTGDESKRTNLTNLSYNNREQIRSAITTGRALYFESGQEYVVRKDKETFSYDTKGNIQKVISELDYDSSYFLEIETTYSFDYYNNPIQLIQRATGIDQNNSIIYIGPIASSNSFFAGHVINYFQNNLVSYSSIPQTDDDSYVQYSYKTQYSYNKYGYPISAEEIVIFLNRNQEYTNHSSWEYEEF